ncbi:exopolysaccharide biosynthesis protein [Nodosilinea sp. LEGE 06152]|uniref:exopolysaccharide biosynthesis protein n=1 Tax=Nodosilinea sp. LEGE 06152 TaxID=2777966 RepID=UPI00187FE56D|nr:exopolysaccharide biosynthesis protein [Nodosilinea sp. LEGE 06152]MBE9157513.1 exopolysaccharide biosynthesis protein [Nodosilinea sp. LEGE 06152]
MARLSTELNRYFFEEVGKPQVTLKEILTLAGERTFGFLFVLLALPSALPVPAPGYSTPFGIVMFLLAVQLIAGRTRPWMPEGWNHKQFDLVSVQKIVKAGSPWLRRLEAVSRPRLTPVCTSLVGRTVLGIAIALMSISMMIPIPGTNTLPAMGIFVTGFGLLDDDGIISLGGLVLCLLGGSLTTLILLFGYEAVKTGIEFLLQR